MELVTDGDDCAVDCWLSELHLECDKCLSECNSRGCDVTKHCWNINITGNPLRDVLRMVTSQLCESNANSYFTNIAT